MNSKQSLYHQIKRSILPRLSLFFLCIVTSASVLYFFLGQKQLNHQHENYIERLRTNLSTNLENLTSNIDNMSKNDLLINGLVDFQMRDDYLPIFFQGLRVFKTKEMGVSLFDFSGNIFLEKGWPGEKITHLQPEWKSKVFQNGQNYIHLDSQGILIVTPIFIANSVEGALGSYLEDIDPLIDTVFEEDINQFIFDKNGKLMWSANQVSTDTSFQNLEASLNYEFYIVKQWNNLTIVSSQPYSTIYSDLEWLLPFFLLTIIGSILSALLSIKMSAKKASETLSKMNASLIKMSDGKQIHANIISEQKEATELKNIRLSFCELLEKVADLSLSNEKVNNVINSLKDFLIVVNSKGEIILSNCKDNSLFTHVHDSPELFFQEALSSLDSKGNFTFKTYLEYQGSPRTIEWSITPFKDENNKQLGFIFNGVDITQELSMQKSINLRQQAMDISPAAIFIADVSKPNTPLVYVNQAFCKVTGYTKSEVIGNSCYFLLGPASEATHVETIKSALKNQEPCQVVMTNYKKNRELFINSLSLQPVLESDGRVNYYVGVHQDITTEKRTEQLLAQAKEQAEQTTSAQARFFASINHELRTPINGINGMVNALLNTELTEQQRKHAELASMSANNLMLIVNDVLDYSKAESGQLLIENSAFDFSEFCKGLSEYYFFQCQNKGLLFEWVGMPKEKLLINCDRLRLQQILDNLVNNALKFTESGKIKVVTKLEFLSHQNSCTSTQESRVRISFDVEDTGIGIAKEQIGNVFKMFGQVKSNTKKLNSGTGLGLNIAKQLVHLMEGKLSVTSEVNKGSIFSFYVEIDVIEGEEDGSHKALMTNDQGVLSFCSTHIIPQPDHNKLPKTPVVLIVEDNEINQAVVIAALPNAKKLVAANGFKALEVLNKVKVDIDVVLMDCQMPELDGWDTTRLIRDGHVPQQFVDVPIVALTAYTTQADQEKCRQAGMNDYLSKPFNPDQLVGKVNFWTSVRRLSNEKNIDSRANTHIAQEQ